MSGANDTRSSKPNVLNGFEETVKDFWVSRPRRPVAGRKFAGVAAGIGNRYGIDPVVVRIALAVATVLGGFGITFYLLGWLFLPAEGDEVSAAEALIGRGRSGTGPALTVLLGILAVSSSGWSFGGGWFSSWFGGGGLITLALLATALYLLHRDRGAQNRPAPIVATRRWSTAGTAAFTMADATTATSATGTEEPTAAVPGWDPLAADPSAWDLPEEPKAPEPPVYVPPAPPAPRGPKSRIGSATFGLAVLVAGGGVVANLDGVAWFSVQHIIGLTLAVLGLGMVTGSFVRGGRGLIALAVPLSIAGMVLTTVPFHDFNVRDGFSSLEATPTSRADVQPEYKRAAGNIDVDLTQVPMSAPYATTVHNGAGNTTVVVPDTADVTYDCQSDVGNTTCFGHEVSGPGADDLSGTDTGTDGAGGQKITLHVTNGLGNVEVRRG